jgi:DNA mismatch repair protein MutL
LLTSYPAILANRSPQAILLAVVDHLVSKERPPTREVLLNDLLSLMACHAAVKAGDRLGPEEIAALLAQRHLAHNTHHCPHGRPTSLLFSRQELDRQFRRI